LGDGFLDLVYILLIPLSDNPFSPRSETKCFMPAFSLFRVFPPPPRLSPPLLRRSAYSSHAPLSHQPFRSSSPSSPWFDSPRFSSSPSHTIHEFGRDKILAALSSCFSLILDFLPSPLYYSPPPCLLRILPPLALIPKVLCAALYSGIIRGQVPLRHHPAPSLFSPHPVLFLWLVLSL